MLDGVSDVIVVAVFGVVLRGDSRFSPSLAFPFTASVGASVVVPDVSTAAVVVSVAMVADTKLALSRCPKLKDGTVL